MPDFDFHVVVIFNPLWVNNVGMTCCQLVRHPNLVNISDLRGTGRPQPIKYLGEMIIDCPRNPTLLVLQENCTRDTRTPSGVACVAVSSTSRTTGANRLWVFLTRLFSLLQKLVKTYPSVRPPDLRITRFIENSDPSTMYYFLFVGRP